MQLRNANEYPLNQVCLAKDLVYQAEVITKGCNDRKTYIGQRRRLKMGTEITRNHAFDDIEYKNDTELSKYVTLELTVK